MRNLIVAAAVVGALSSGAVFAAAAPTAVQAQAAPIKIYISGSSAAKAGIKAALAGADWCTAGNAMTTFQSNTPDFNAYSCTAGAGPFSGQSTTIYYRAEGGSVVGVMPLINNLTLKQLDLSAAGGCPQTTTGTVNCTVGGTSAANGNNDSWPSGVFTPGIPAQIGISDLEPKAFVGDNFPAQYTFIGAARSVSDLKSTTQLPQKAVFQQVFGIIMNNTPAGIAGVNNLSKQAIKDILAGSYIDWSSVPAAPTVAGLTSQNGAGPAVTAASTNIVVCNREEGSGTRTGASIYFLGDECTSTATPVADTNPPPDNFSTGDEITCVQTHPGSIGYVSIDKQVGLPAGVVAVALDGVLPTNTKAALGQYDWVYEATFQRNKNADANNTAFYNYMLPKLQDVTKAPQSAQVLAIPFLASNNPQMPLQTSGVIATSLFTRNGDSCSRLQSQN